MNDSATRTRLQRVCELISDPAAPYAHTIKAEPGDLLGTLGPPFPSLLVEESQTTPIKQLLYHRQTVTVELRPGEEPERISINRMVGILEDDREVPMGEVWAVPADVVEAAERGPVKCAACGVQIYDVPKYDDAGNAYHAGCFE